MPYYSHNGWLDVGVRGGIVALAFLVLGQVVLLKRLAQNWRASPLVATAFALFVRGTVSMIFEAGAICSTYGLVGYLGIYCIGLALHSLTAGSHRQPRTGQRAIRFQPESSIVSYAHYPRSA
jgi:O-antigen ligase